MGEDRRRAGAIADHIAGLFCRLPQYLCAEVLLGVLEIEFLGYGDAVIADDRRALTLLDQDGLRLGAQRHPYRVGEQSGAAQDLLACGRMKQNLLMGHQTVSAY